LNFGVLKDSPPFREIVFDELLERRGVDFSLVRWSQEIERR